MSKLYILQSVLDGNRKKMAENNKILTVDEDALLSGKMKIEGMEFVVRNGFQKFDFLETAIPGFYLVSSKVYHFFQTNNINAVSFSEVLLSEKKGDLSFTYYFLHIESKSGPLDYRASLVVSKDYSFVELKGRYIEPGTVPNTEIFVPAETSFIFLKEGLKKIMEIERFSNLEFISQDEIVGAIPYSIYMEKIGK